MSRLNSCFGIRASSRCKLLILLSQEQTAGVDADCWTMGLHLGYAQTRRTKELERIEQELNATAFPAMEEGRIARVNRKQPH